MVKKVLKHPCEVYLINISKVIWSSIEHKNFIENRGPHIPEEYHKAWTRPSTIINDKLFRKIEEHARKVNSQNLRLCKCQLIFSLLPPHWII